MDARWLETFRVLAERQLRKASCEAERQRALSGLAGVLETNALAHYNSVVRVQSSILWAYCDPGNARVHAQATAEVRHEQERIARLVQLHGSGVAMVMS